MTAEARAYAAEGAVAYGPVIAWLRSDAHRSTAAPARPRAQAAELAPLLSPTPRRRPRRASGAEQRTRLFARARRRRCSAADTPLLLVADDLQWFDAPTLQFLHYLLRSAPDAPLLVAATARREELDAGHPLPSSPPGCRRSGAARRSRSGGSAARRRASSPSSLRGAPLDAAQADRLFAASEGNPLYLVEAAQAARRTAAGACRR